VKPPMNPAAARGFTLMEVLIGATLLAVMMLLLTGSLRIGAESWDSGEERMAKASRLYIAENFLRAHIASLLPIAGTLKNGEMIPAFRGTRDSLNYVAPLPEQVRAGGLYRFELYVGRKDGDTKDLRMAILPYSTGPDQGRVEAPIDDLAIVENLKELKLSYLPPVFQATPFSPVQGQGQGQTAQWTDEWQQPQLPALIRIDIEPEGEEPWPTLFIAPRTLMLR
jgi:general secretion pathway protein J